jgi:hypothetical protein
LDDKFPPGGHGEEVPTGFSLLKVVGQNFAKVFIKKSDADKSSCNIKKARWCSAIADQCTVQIAGFVARSGCCLSEGLQTAPLGPEPTLAIVDSLHVTANGAMLSNR